MADKPLTLTQFILKVLYANQSYCMDSANDRKTLAEILADALTKRERLTRQQVRYGTIKRRLGRALFGNDLPDGTVVELMRFRDDGRLDVTDVATGAHAVIYEDEFVPLTTPEKGTSE